MVKPQAIPYLCVAGMLIVFAIDLATPQLFVVAILLDGPIVLSSFSGSRRFTGWLVVAALFANVVAGYVNGVHDHHHWATAGIADRVLTGLSIVFVGYLSTVIQENARRFGALSSSNARAQREVRLRAAIEPVRASLNPEVIERAVVRESVTLLDASFARFFLLTSVSQNPTTLAHERGTNEVSLSIDRPRPELTSLMQRAFDVGDVLVVQRSDPVARFVLDTIAAESAIVAPVADGDIRFGVLVVGRTQPASFGEGAVDVTRRFVEQSALALSQARLFVELAQRNDELAAANDAIAERSEIIRDIVYALSHDLRTPLVAIAMTIRQALDGAYGELPGTYRDILRTTLLSTDELQRLAQNLLLVARYESGDEPVAREALSLASMAESVVHELDVLARARSQTVLVIDETSGSQPNVVANEGEMRRVLTNLVANAMSYTQDGGEITIHTGIEGGGVVFSVEDDGFGIPDEMRSSLFERFGARNGRRGGGTGIGLYIVRRIIEAHGGSITYAARSPRGSIFRVTLPEPAVNRKIGSA